ncbi:MAG: hypothetical protein IPG46_01710 [Actinobacteria bacterium]|nr:hypothetical protein [Actinomycetota bacterium]
MADVVVDAAAEPVVEVDDVERLVVEADVVDDAVEDDVVAVSSLLSLSATQRQTASAATTAATSASTTSTFGSTVRRVLSSASMPVSNTPHRGASIT